MIPRVWMATRIALGVSASVYLATLNNIHGDSDEKTASAAESTADSSPGAGFTTDKSEWYLPIRHLGNLVPNGIIRMYWFSRYDTRVRIMSRGPRTLISVLDGEFVARANVSDVLQENVWFNLENLFKWYQIDHSTHQPVEFIHEPHPTPEAIQTVIKTAIKFTDEYILNYFLGRVFSSLSKKNAGDAIRATASSCLVSAMYEADVRLLHVASLGNMRGILGRPREAEDGSVTYDVHVLSEDHTPDNPAERSRIESLHAGEDFIEDGTVLGRPYTRALGDGKLKWSTEVQARLHADYLGAAPDPKVKTPPYISAEPDVSTIKILPGDFLVLSSRWLTECLTDEEVVGLVGVWLDKNQNTTLRLPSANMPPPDPAPGPAILPEDLPVDLKQDNTIYYRRWNAPKHFINADVNPATHLSNNAMGGADSGLRQTLLGLAPFESEGNTKPLGIVVVFFQ
ncbi:phosphatase 2C-like domain-containing protein [Mycena rosella]|uniref:Phosphatase 2C-like domain-containing protein n=1 Tax=Mycena rosella TaxID=1033263 RepID=A0AAD7DVG3_MYCRO|nr:phosphatase 2C-like domain-containing protein [Mycena rosella]